MDPVAGGYAQDRKWTEENASELIEYSFVDAHSLNVPADWNSQKPELFYYEGTVWYQKTFEAPTDRAGKRFLLHFGGANYETDVYLNSRKLGRHIGGFTPFQFDVTNRLHEGSNTLVIRVNNKRLKEGVPTVNTDWWNYGGITREVRLLELPETYIADYSIQLASSTSDDLEFSIDLDGSQPQQEVSVSIPELNIETVLQTDQDGFATARFSPSNLERWTPDKPRLYSVGLKVGSEHLKPRIGFRSIETRGREILLNGQPIFLRGICIHEENPLRGGRAAIEEDARLLLAWAKELGCNFARLAHYPHNEHMARLADEMGILLWEEIPVYWTIDWENADTLANARQQLTELIERDKNRASVIVWSVANETPPSEQRTRFLRTLVDQARELDDTRLISAALEVHGDPQYPGYTVMNDPFGAFTDIVSFNQYQGWYGPATPDQLTDVKWKILSEKPVFISEFGGGALSGFHGPKTTRFTEEYQAWLYEETLPMLERIEGLSGMSPWILVDFRSPRRALHGIQDGWNRKGLIGDQGAQKQAFDVVKRYYEKKSEEYENR